MISDYFLCVLDKQQQDGPGFSLSTSAPKTTTPPLVTNGSGVVHAGNLLPSSLLKNQPGAVPAGGARRAVSTLIASTPNVENTSLANFTNQQKPKGLFFWNYGDLCKDNIP